MAVSAPPRRPLPSRTSPSPVSGRCASRSTAGPCRSGRAAASAGSSSTCCSTGAAVPREELTGVFWPGWSPSHARNNLNVSVWGLRTRLREPLGGDRVGGGAYRLDPALAIRVDAEELERSSPRRGSAGARGTSRAPRPTPVRGGALRPGDLFEDDRYEAWIDPFRRGLAETDLAAVTNLAEFERRLGDSARPWASAAGASPWSPSVRISTGC